MMVKPGSAEHVSSPHTSQAGEEPLSPTRELTLSLVCANGTHYNVRLHRLNTHMCAIVLGVNQFLD